MLGNAMGPHGYTGLETGDLILGILLLVVGLLLAFMGEDIWSAVLGFIGAIVGWAIGYAIGSVLFPAPGDWWIPLILGMVCAFIGSMLFSWLVEVALSILAGAMAAGVAYMVYPEWWVALVVFFVVAILVYIFIDEVVAVLTAIVGGILVGCGVFLLAGTVWLALLAGFLAFAGGAAYQLFIDDD
jgi:hypothetical protein